MLSSRTTSCSGMEILSMPQPKHMESHCLSVHQMPPRHRCPAAALSVFTQRHIACRTRLRVPSTYSGTLPRMNILQIRTIHGPNVFTHNPVLVMRLALE